MVQDIDFHDAEEKAHVSGAEFPGTNAARLWEAFANGATGMPVFASCLVLHFNLSWME